VVKKVGWRDDDGMRDDPTVVSLVERALDGDQGAWNQLVERYATLVWSVCRRYGLAGSDAEDVGANVWLRLVERLGTIREPAALPGWLATTTRRECLQLLRANSKQIPVEDDRFPDEGSAPSDEWLLAQERHIALRRGFAELSERCRKLLSMLFDDPPAAYGEIATTLGMTIGGIGPTRSRCLDKLRASPAVAAMMEIAPTSGR
jgi:RNA polymerase sigma factor (sigma-70 family)